MRKIVQISALPEIEGYYPALYILCDDGTLWIYFPKDSTWEKCLPIPQDENPELSFVEQLDRVGEMLDRRES